MGTNEHLKNTLEAMYNQKVAPSGILRINQGMQFDRPGVQYMWFLLLALLIGTIASFIQAQWIFGVICLLVTPLLIAYIIDIRGFEVDFKNQKIRKYASFLGSRQGEWEPISAFNAVRVYLNELKTTKGKFTNMGPKKFDTHSYYYVRLVSEGLNTSISLLELKDYKRAKYQAEKIARHAKLRLIEKPAKTKTIKV